MIDPLLHWITLLLLLTVLGIQADAPVTRGDPSPEGDRMTYAEPVTCPGFMPSRLILPGSGYVLTPAGPLGLRAQATYSSDALAQIPGGALFELLAGPVCADATAWWYVDFNGTRGWLPEGAGDTYWLIPPVV